MSKARVLANLISDNAELADGQISVAEVVGAAPTASPTFTGNIGVAGNITNASGNLTLDVAGDITLDADGADVLLKDDGVQFGKLSSAGGTDTFNIVAVGEDRAIKFFGNDGGSSVNALTLEMAGGGTARFSQDIKLLDNGKAIFGAGSDLQIYHNGSNSYVTDAGQGKLILSTNGTAVDVYDNANGHTMAQFINNGAVSLSYQGSPKIATTAAGISVTGTSALGGDTTVTGILSVHRPSSGYGAVEVGGPSGGLIDLKAPTSDDYDARIIYNNANSLQIITLADEPILLRHADTTRLSTTSTGIDVFGTATMDGLTVDGDLSVDIGTIKLDGNYPIGAGNVALGNAALGSIQTGTASNTIIGSLAGTNITTGASNTASGRQALQSNTTGSDLTAIGRSALQSNTTASSNTAVGYQSGHNNTTGSQHAFFGSGAGFSNNTGNYNTFIGRRAGYSTTTGSDNTIVGNGAGSSHTTGSSNGFFGTGAGNAITTGSKNTILGRYNGNQNGLDIRTTDNNIVLSDGDGIPRIQINQNGEIAANTTVTSSTTFSTSFSGADVRRCLLWHQGNSSSGRPRMLLESHTSGAVIDVNSTFNSDSQRSLLRFYRKGTNCGRIEATPSSTAYTTTSDYRLKENVVELTGATERLKQLDPKRFNFIADADTTVDGFIAHEVQSVVPEAVVGTHNEVEKWEEAESLPDGVSLGDNKLDENGNTIPKYQGIDQAKLVPLLVKTIQELEARITALEA